MTRFNIKAKSVARTDNLAGGEAFVESPELELVSVLLTSFVQDQFYRGSSDTLQRVGDLISQIRDKRFCGQAAILARTKWGMRSISHVVAAEIGRRVKGATWTKRFFDRIVYRPDDMSEILAHYWSFGNKAIPNAMKKGFAAAFGRFDSYSLAKYRSEGKAISLVDVVNLVHPKPTERNSEALRELVAGTLRSFDTWEVELTRAGQVAKGEEEKAELKAKVWRDLVTSHKIGYFALLRNLRNILEQAPDALPKACEMLLDESLIRKSLVLPFRFWTAILNLQVVEGSRVVIGALSKALDISLANVPELEGRTLVVLDESGSMQGSMYLYGATRAFTVKLGREVSGNIDPKAPINLGAIFAAVLYKACNADLMTFAGEARYANLDPESSTASIAAALVQRATFGSTNFRAIFPAATRAYDRVIILSDMQGWVGYRSPMDTLQEYQRRMGVHPKVYSFDLQGYGTLEFPEVEVCCLAGFSEKVFDIMKMLETDKRALIHEVEKVAL